MAAHIVAAKPANSIRNRYVAEEVLPGPGLQSSDFAHASKLTQPRQRSTLSCSLPRLIDVTGWCQPPPRHRTLPVGRGAPARSVALVAAAGSRVNGRWCPAAAAAGGWGGAPTLRDQRGTRPGGPESNERKAVPRESHPHRGSRRHLPEEPGTLEQVAAGVRLVYTITCGPGPRLNRKLRLLVILDLAASRIASKMLI